MKVISFLNIKGGVGKTMSTIAFAQILHNNYGKRVLVLDVDKQGNASKYLGCHSNEGLTSADLLTSRDIIIRDAIKHSEYGVDVIPANFDLVKANLDTYQDARHIQQFRYKNQLKEVQGDYDYCIIDLPPDVNMCVINALAATDDVLIPVKFDKGACEGMQYVLEVIEDIKGFNDKIQFKGCFLTMFVRSNLNQSGLETLKKELGVKCFNTYIRQTVKVGESTFAKPLMTYSPRCNAAKDYLDLVAEYLNS